MIRPLLVYGLDGSSLDILRAYTAAFPGGIFSRVLAEGASAPLASTLPYFTGPAWTTFATGVDPARHGMFHWRGRFSLAAGGRPLISSAHLAKATIWSWVQENGGRVSVSNFPMEYPAPAVAGRYICGTLAPEDAADTSWPPQLIAKVRAALPDYRFEMIKGLSYMDRPVELRDHILQIGNNHFRAMAEFCQAAGIAFCCHVVTITDRMQHFFWNYHDPAHPDHSAMPDGSDPVFTVYAEAERQLERLWDSGYWRNLLLVSDHGMGPSTIAFHADTWLVERGYAVAKSEKIDVAASLAYSAEEPECAIYVNRADRDGCGVPPGNYPALVERLAAELGALRQPDGSPAFERVHHAAEIHKGAFGEQAPDLILEPAEGVHPRPGLAATAFSRATRLVAGHRRPGLFAVYGPDVVAADPDEPLHIRDMFPLMCALMDIPCPGGLDGRLPAELVAAPAAPASDVSWAHRIGMRIERQGENADTSTRLRELGYDQ